MKVLLTVQSSPGRTAKLPARETTVSFDCHRCSNCLGQRRLSCEPVRFLYRAKYSALLAAIAFFSATCATWLTSRTVDAQEENAAAVTTQRLIEQLGSQEFQQREAASAELLRIGEPALVALATAERGADFETRERARAIRQRIEREKYDFLAQTFLRDPDPTAAYGLPGWKSFASVAGATPTAKRLFLEMVDQRRLVALCLESIDGGSGKIPDGVFEDLPKDLQQRLRTVIGRTCTEIRHGLYVKGSRPVIGDILALLLSAAVLDDPPQDLHDAIRSEIQFGGIERLVSQRRACVRKLLGKWILKAPLTMGEEVMLIAHQMQVPEGADMARRVLANPGDKEVTSRALICLARFGDTSDLDLIDKFVEDMTVLSLEPTIMENDFREERSAPPPGAPPVQPPANPPKYRRLVSDVALVAGLKIAKFDLPEFFPGIRAHDDFVVMESTIGFPVDHPEVRAAAVKAWREFRAKAAQQPAS